MWVWVLLGTSVVLGGGRRRSGRGYEVVRGEGSCEAEGGCPLCCVRRRPWGVPRGFCDGPARARRFPCVHRPRVRRTRKSSHSQPAQLAPDEDSLALQLNCSLPDASGLTPADPPFRFAHQRHPAGLRLNATRLQGLVRPDFLDKEIWCWYLAQGTGATKIHFYSPTGYFLHQCRRAAGFRSVERPHHCWRAVEGSGGLGPALEEELYRWHWEPQWYLGPPLCRHHVQAYNRLVAPDRRAHPPHFLCCAQPPPHSHHRPPSLSGRHAPSSPPALRDPFKDDPGKICSRDQLDQHSCGRCQAWFPDWSKGDQPPYRVTDTNGSHEMTYEVGWLKCRCTSRSGDVQETKALLSELEEGAKSWSHLADPLERFVERKELLGLLAGSWEAGWGGEAAEAQGPLCALTTEKPPITALDCSATATLRRLFRFQSSQPAPCRFGDSAASLNLSVLPKSALNEQLHCLLGVSPPERRAGEEWERRMEPPKEPGLPPSPPFPVLSARLRSGTNYVVRDCLDTTQPSAACWLTSRLHPHWLFFVRRRPFRILPVWNNDHKYSRTWLPHRTPSSQSREQRLLSQLFRQSTWDFELVRGGVVEVESVERRWWWEVRLAVAEGLVGLTAIGLLLLLLWTDWRERERLRRLDGAPEGEEEEDASLDLLLDNFSSDEEPTPTSSSPNAQSSLLVGPSGSTKTPGSLLSTQPSQALQPRRADASAAPSSALRTPPLSSVGGPAKESGTLVRSGAVSLNPSLSTHPTPCTP